MFLLKNDLRKEEADQLLLLSKYVCADKESARRNWSSNELHTVNGNESTDRERNSETTTSIPKMFLRQRRGGYGGNNVQTTAVEGLAIRTQLERRSAFVSLQSAASRGTQGSTAMRSSCGKQPQWNMCRMSTLLNISHFFTARSRRIDSGYGLPNGLESESVNEADDDPCLIIERDTDSIASGIPADLRKVQCIGFGDQTKRFLFTTVAQGVFLNAGSYGATPRGVVRAVEVLEGLEQRDPVQFDVDARTVLLKEVTARLAAFLHCDADCLCLMTNCNSATSTVLKSLPWQCGDKLLMLSCEYDATIAAAKWLHDTIGVQLETLRVRFPVSDAIILSDLRTRLQALHQHGGNNALPRLANFCHVTSKTAWIFPIKEMIAICHDFGVAVLVDGAHAPGHIPDLNIDELNADFYCGTCHKWMYSCQGVAFLCVNSPSAQQLLTPLVASEGSVVPFSAMVGSGSSSSSVSGVGENTSGSLSDRFAQSIPTSQLPTFLSLWAAMDFVEIICGGWRAVQAYQQRLAQEAACYLHQEWQLNEEGIEFPCIQWEQVGPAGHDASEEQALERMSTTTTNTSILKKTRPRSVGNCMPLIPIPNSRDATEKDAKTLMGFLLTRFQITCFIVVAPVWAYRSIAKRVNGPQRAEGPSRQRGQALPGNPVMTDAGKGFVDMLVLRFTSQIHTSQHDIHTIGAAVRALQLASGSSSSRQRVTPDSAGLEYDDDPIGGDDVNDAVYSDQDVFGDGSMS